MTMTEATQRGQTTTRASRGRTTTATPSPAPTPARKAKEKEKGPQFDLNLPFVRIQVRPPDLHLPELHMPHVELPRVNRRDMGHAVDIARTFLPPPERIVYYGGLGALAVIGLIEWPVAAAIGAGTMIAQRARARQDRWSPLRGQQPQRATPSAGRVSGRTAEEKAAEAMPKATPRATAQKGGAKGTTKAPARSTAARVRAGAK